MSVRKIGSIEVYTSDQNLSNYTRKEREQFVNELFKKEYQINNYPHLEKYLEYLFIATDEQQNKHSKIEEYTYFPYNDQLIKITNVEQCKKLKTDYRNLIRKNQVTYDMVHSCYYYFKKSDLVHLKLQYFLEFLKYCHQFNYIKYCLLITHLHEKNQIPHVHFIYICPNRYQFKYLLDKFERRGNND